MLIKSNYLIGCSLHATDGDIGKITSLYFDCERWRVRYLASHTGGRQVLIPVASVPHQDFKDKKIYVNLSREQVLNSPDVDFNLAVSRTMENDIARHYNVQKYWEVEQPVMRQGRVIYMPEEDRTVTMGENMVIVADRESGTTMIAERISDASDLYSSEEVKDYTVHANDGDVGKIDDYIVDDATWDINYAIVNTGSWLPGRHVLLSPEWIDSISYDDREVRIDVNRDAIRNSPEYDPRRPLTMDYLHSLTEHYRRETGRSLFALWRFTAMRHTMPTGRKLRIESKMPAVVRWTADEWKTYDEVKTKDLGNNIHAADLDTDNVPSGRSVHFTFFWPLSNTWEGKNYSVKVLRAAEQRVPAGVR